MIEQNKKNPVKKFFHIIEALLVVGMAIVFSRFPINRFRRIVSFAGNLLFRLDHRDRRRAFQNLDIVSEKRPLSEKEKIRITGALFTNLVTLAIEYIQLGRLQPENMAAVLKVENHRAVDDALREKRGVLLLTAHLGNWEYLGVLGSRLGYHVATVLKHQHNPYMDRWLTRIRENHAGVRCFYLGGGINHNISAHLRQNGILAIVADQRDISSPFRVPFFGLPALTSAGPAKLHLWFQSPMVFGFCIRQPDGRYRITFDGPFHFTRTGEHQKDCLRIMTFINQKYENMIRKYPDQWLTLFTPRWRIS